MKVYSHSFFAMNTRFVLVIPGLKQERGDVLSAHAEELVEALELCLSRFRPEAELFHINAHAGQEAVPVSECMAGVLDLCEHFYTLTGRLFDPAFHKGLGWEKLVWDRDKQEVSFSDSGLMLDFGGMGKGLALKEVVAYLKAEGIEHAFLSFGESSIAGIGKHPHGEGWPLGLARAGGDSGDAILLRDQFASISGLQKEKSEDQEHVHAHILHPLKGELVHLPRQVLVRSNCPVEAEVLSTCAYLSDQKELAFLEQAFPDSECYISGS